LTRRLAANHNPLIDGVAHASTEQLQLLNAPLNRSGGNNYEPLQLELNAIIAVATGFFESIGDEKAEPAERAIAFIARSKAAGAQRCGRFPCSTGSQRLAQTAKKLAELLRRKYGAQQKTDQYMADAGNGLKPDGSEITGNDPLMRTRQQPGVSAGVRKASGAESGAQLQKGGLRYYIMDNEPHCGTGHIATCSRSA
jgi:hypothetical protein